MDQQVLSQLREGQDVKVVQKVIEGKRERNVPFAGKLLKVRGIGPNKMITVRQILENVAVERIFPVFSPTLVKIEIANVNDEQKTKTQAVKKKTKSKSLKKKRA
jgi:large subunit ribosomal protein L19